MKKTFLLMKNLKVTQASAMGNLYTVGFPAITGILGAVHAWQRELKLKHHIDIEFNETSIFIQDIQTSSAHKKFTPARLCERASQLKAVAATVDKRDLDVELDLILSFSVPDEDEKDIKCFLERSDCLREMVLSRAFCGGIVASIGLLRCTDILSSALNSVPSQFFVVECAGEKLETVQKNYACDALEAMLMLCERGANASKIPEADFYAIPLAVGYAALEDTPQKRGRARQDNHIYAEPVLSLGRLRTVGSLRLQERIEDNPTPCKFFWKHQTSQDGLYVAEAFSTKEISQYD